MLVAARDGLRAKLESEDCRELDAIGLLLANDVSDCKDCASDSGTAQFLLVFRLGSCRLLLGTLRSSSQALVETNCASGQLCKNVELTDHYLGTLEAVTWATIGEPVAEEDSCRCLSALSGGLPISSLL